MADNETMYAWSNIQHHDSDKGLTIIKPGTPVSQDKLGYDDSAWAELLEGGAVRPTRWPKGLDPDNPNGLSPNEHRLRQLRVQREALESEMAGVGGSSTQDDEADKRATTMNVTQAQ